MSSSSVRFALASLTLAAAALGACVTPIGNYCAEKASCEDLAPQQEKICNIDLEEGADVAGVWGCSSEFDALTVCVVDNMQCKNRGTPEADLDIRKGVCKGEELVYEDCIEKAQEDVVECAPGCTLAMTKNSVCDSASNNIQCGYDDNQCSSNQCASGCSTSMLANGTCDSACDTAQCGYDGGDCSSGGDCSPGCPQSYRGDGTCDADCNNASCNYDNGDCN